MQLGTFLNLLVKPKRQPDGSFLALCPAHADRKTLSLHVSQADDKILLKCFAGCSAEAIADALKIEMADLFTEAKQPTRKIVAEYTYQDEHGNELYQVVRFDPKGFSQRHRNGKNDYVWNMDGVRRVLYRLPEVIASDRVILCEGEKDADNLRKHGLIATTSPGGAGAWKPEYADYLTGKQVVLIPDNDKAGYQYAREIARSVQGKVTGMKCIILPGDAKDVSDWLQANKPELLAALEQDIAVLDSVEEVKPTATKTLNGFEFAWPGVPLKIYLDRLTNDAEGIISTKDSRGATTHVSKINLLAPRSLSELAKRLNQLCKADWDNILSFISSHCYGSLRDGGETVNIDIEPQTMEIKYLLSPILPMREPVTIFTAGGKGKSILADYFAVLVQHGWCGQSGLNFIPRGSANVLILDWEADEETHRRYITAIKKGLGITDYSFIAYRRMEYPLAQVIESVKAEIVARAIELVILDSQMAATAGGSRAMSEAQIASEYYNLIRSLNCSTLTIDHITKASMFNTDGAEAPYGSIVKYNRSRSQFELRLPDEEDDSDHKEYALIHRKFNLGRKQKPLGIAADFTNEGETLIQIDYKSLDLEQSTSLAKVVPRKTRLMNALKVMGRASIRELAEAVGEPDNVDKISVQLANDKKTFVRIGEAKNGIYGLLQKGT